MRLAPAPLILAAALTACGPTTGPSQPPPNVAVADPADTATAPPAEPEPEPEPAAHKRASDYTLDGFRLGGSYGEVMQRAPYDEPCDNDPIDKRARRFMVYGALPCRGKQRFGTMPSSRPAAPRCTRMQQPPHHSRRVST